MKQKLWQKLPSQESGFTIIESLVALMVAGILLAAVAPVIVLSVATRVQAKRVEIATDAARNYIDGVRSGIISAPSYPSPTQDTLAAYSAPAVGSLTCSTNFAYCTSPTTNLYCVNLDSTAGCSSTSADDLVIQAIRFRTITDPTDTPTPPARPTRFIHDTDASKDYQLLVRVYRADGFAAGSNLKRYCKQPTFTAGLGDRKAPLAELTTEISRNVTFNNLSDRLSAPASTDNNIPTKCS
jgi:prepilin-type N-terminal cleavage/methylation domain-containing protein